jgi:hypothetical protein
MSKNLFDGQLNGGQLADAMRKHNSPAACFFDSARAHVVDGDFSGGNDHALDRLCGTLVGKGIIPAGFVRSGIRPILDDIQSNSFFSLSVLHDKNIKPGAKRDFVFLGGNATAAQRLSRISGVTLPEDGSLNAAAMRNFFNLYSVCLNAYGGNQIVRPLIANGMRFERPGVTTPPEIGRAAFVETRRIFTAAGDSRTPELWKAAWELRQATTGLLDARLYPPIFSTFLGEAADTMRLHLAMPAVKMPETMPQQQAFRDATILARAIGKSPQQLDEGIKKFVECNFRDAARLFGEYRDGKIDPAQVALATEIQAYDKAEARVALIKAESDPVQMAGGLRRLLMSHPANIDFEPEAYKMLASIVDNNQAYGADTIVFADEAAQNRYYQSGTLVILDRMAGALSTLAPSSCAKAGLDMNQVTKIRNVRPAVSAGPGVSEANRARLN